MSTPDIAPTVVLVHGAFVDASSWNGVIAELNAADIDVVAPPNPLRGVGVDAAYLNHQPQGEPASADEVLAWPKLNGQPETNAERTQRRMSTTRWPW